MFETLLRIFRQKWSVARRQSLNNTEVHRFLAGGVRAPSEGHVYGHRSVAFSTGPSPKQLSVVRGKVVNHEVCDCLVRLVSWLLQEDGSCNDIVPQNFTALVSLWYLRERATQHVAIILRTRFATVCGALALVCNGRGQELERIWDQKFCRQAISFL